MYYISFRECKLWYLYVRKTHHWDQEEFITIKVAKKLLGILILLVVLPLLKKFKISDLNLLIAFNFLHGVGFLLGCLSMYSTGFLISGQYFSDRVKYKGRFPIFVVDKNLWLTLKYCKARKSSSSR